MTNKQYSDFVKRYWMGGGLLHSTLGLCGEAGELAEVVKKGVFYPTNPDIDTAQCLKELGDVLFYVVATANELGFDLNYVMGMNKAKLEDRYGVK